MALRRLAASSLLRQVARQAAEGSALTEAGVSRTWQAAGSRDVHFAALWRSLASQSGGSWQGSWASQQQQSSGLHCWPSLQQAAQPAVADEELEPEAKPSPSSKVAISWERGQAAADASSMHEL